jgi:hypothetical protein
MYHQAMLKQILPRVLMSICFPGYVNTNIILKHHVKHKCVDIHMIDLLVHGTGPDNLYHSYRSTLIHAICTSYVYIVSHNTLTK